MNRKTITAQIEEEAYRLLRKHPEGIRWSDLNSKIKESNPDFHPKTVNGVIWKMPQKFPEKISKIKGLYSLKK